MRTLTHILLLAALAVPAAFGQATVIWTGGGGGGGPYDLENDGVSGIADSELLWGTGAGTATYTDTLDALINLDSGFEVGDFRCTASAGVLTCQDPTATTGSTRVIFKGGAGQSGNVFEIQSNGGGTTAGFGDDGLLFVTRIDINDGGTRPSCDSSVRGTIWVDEGGAGVADDASICLKDAADAHAWTAIATP